VLSEGELCAPLPTVLPRTCAPSGPGCGIPTVGKPISFRPDTNASSSGDTYVWYMNGTTITGGAYVYIGGNPAWQIVGPK